ERNLADAATELPRSRDGRMSARRPHRVSCALACAEMHAIASGAAAVAAPAGANPLMIAALPDPVVNLFRRRPRPRPRPPLPRPPCHDAGGFTQASQPPT